MAAGVLAEMKIKVIAHPSSKISRVKEDISGCLDVYVNKPAVDGKANKEIIVLLADFFGVKKNQVFLISGEKSKNKLFEITSK